MSVSKKGGAIHRHKHVFFDGKLLTNSAHREHRRRLIEEREDQKACSGVDRKHRSYRKLVKLNSSPE